MHLKYASNMINHVINRENNALVFGYYTCLTGNNLYASPIGRGTEIVEFISCKPNYRSDKNVTLNTYRIDKTRERFPLKRRRVTIPIWDL